jgi:hypothetical protein
MKKSTRVVVFGVVVEVGLAVLMVWLMQDAGSEATHLTVPRGEAVERIATVIGGVMGGFLGYCLLIYTWLRRQGR